MENTMSEKLTTPLDKRVRLYQHYNKSCLDENHLVCFDCHMWLTKAIYLVKGGHNICEPCTTYYGFALRNTSLEQLLHRAGQYPCKYSERGCNVYSPRKDVLKHETICDFNFSCYCNLHLESKEALEEHMKINHSMSIIILEKPVAEISLTEKMLAKESCIIFKLLAGEISFIVLMRLIVQSLYIVVYNGTYIKKGMKFMVKYVNSGSEYRVYGNVTERCSFTSAQTMLNLAGLKAIKWPLSVKIYFDNYENFEMVEDSYQSMLKEFECPICLETITDCCYQCLNGHNVCPSCTKMITVCPICRFEVNKSIVKIKRLATHCQRTCKNSAKGCFVYGHNTEIMIHENTCVMREIKCDACSKCFDREAYFHHMYNLHSMQKLTETPAVVQPGYIFYRENVFKLVLDNVHMNRSRKRQMRWSFYLLYSSNKSCGYYYTMEVVIDEHISTLHSKITETIEHYNVITPINDMVTPDFNLTLH